MPLISDRLFQKASINKIPLNAGFELSPICNFSCRMCYVRRTKEQIEEEGKSLRSWKEWLKLAEECWDEGTLYVLLTGGEPFLYPGFKNLYKELHKMGFLISINTNGTMIDHEMIEWLKENAPYRINITLYGASSETYGRVCHNPQGYEKAVTAIKLLKEAGIPVVINASMIPENAVDLEKIMNFGKSLGINTRVSTYMFPPARRHREEQDSRFTPDQSAEMYIRKMKCQFEPEVFYQKMDKLIKSVNDKKSLQSDDWGNHTEYMRCRAGRSSFWVSWEGVMTACGMLPFPLETFPFENSFRNCWKELTDKVRTTPVLKACSKCEKRDVCGPCVAMQYTEIGDVNGKAPYLCEMSECIIKHIEELVYREA